MIKPGHLRDFCEQNDDHLDDLLVEICLFLHQKVDKKVFDVELLANWDLQPMLRKKLLECGGCYKLDKA